MSGSLTFYGHFSGYSSYPVVCQNLLRWLEMQAPFAVQAIDLRTAKLPYRQNGPSLLFGFPTHVKEITPNFERFVGYHVCDVDKIPELWVEIMNQEAHVLTPSAWCKQVFEQRGVSTPISIVPHGINPSAFCLPPRKYPRQRVFTFRHFTSSSGERKGTVELIRAFKRAFRETDPVILVIHGGGITDEDYRIYVSNEGPLPSTRQAERYWTTDVLVQPSRAEGFGMQPLEALACGTPVISTRCTGHEQWWDGEIPGLVKVFTDGFQPCKPGDGMAPTIDEDHLVYVLRGTWHDHARLKHAALRNSCVIRRHCAWDRQLDNSPLLDVLRSIM
jgi:glycosyltransferase involved in cell wall biosynthesis